MASPLTLLEPAKLEIARYGNCHSISMLGQSAPTVRNFVSCMAPSAIEDPLPSNFRCLRWARMVP